MLKRRLTGFVLSLISCFLFLSVVPVIAAEEPVWTKNLDIATDTFFGVAYGNNTFVAVGTDGAIKTSQDGTDWISVDSGVWDGINKVIWDGRRFIAIDVKETILTSGDAVNWTSYLSEINSQISNISWNGSIYVAVGEYSIFTSSDGLVWTRNKTASYVGVLKDII